MTADTDRQGGEARNHEAEVEAVTRAISNALLDQAGKPISVRPLAIAALDAVRCAQGRDTDAPEPTCTCGSHAVIDANRHDETCWRRLWVERSPQGGGPEPTAEELERDCEAIAEARRAMHPRYGSQGEDHEAGIEAALVVWPGRILTRAAVEAVVAAYLSRCSSPKRLGELLDGETK